MNSKMKIAVGCGILLLILGGLYWFHMKNKPQSDMPLMTKTIKEIIEETESLATNDIPSSTILAKELTNVLASHHVSLPDSLAQLKPPQAPVPDPDESQIKLTFEHGEKILELCKNSTWTKDPDYALPAPLRNELLIAIVNYSPSSMNRVRAAEFLVERALPGDEATYIPDVSDLQANNACIVAINHVLKRAAEGKVDPHMASGASLVLLHLLLESRITENPTKESLDQFLLEYISKTDAALESADDERVITVLNNLKTSLQNAEEYTGLYAQVVTYRKELEHLIKTFLDAVNKEDKELASRYLTNDMSSDLLKEESLRNKISLRSQDDTSPKVNKIEFRSIIELYNMMDLRDGQNGYVLVELEVIDENGRSQIMTRELPVVQTSKGWLIGSKD